MKQQKIIGTLRGRTRGKTFPGVRAAARMLGVDFRGLKRALKNGTIFGGRRWEYSGERAGTNSPKPILVDGREFPSIGAAGRFLKTRDAWVREAANREGNCCGRKIRWPPGTIRAIRAAAAKLARSPFGTPRGPDRRVKLWEAVDYRSRAG